MWTDNEIAQDILNFGGTAKTVAEIIGQAQSRPISIGVSGAWGVGKSSMIKLIRNELSARHDEESKPVQQVVGRRADLAHVGTVSTAPAADGDQRLLFHQTPDNLLGYPQRTVAERMQLSIAVAPVVTIEGVDHSTTDFAIFVGRVEPGQVVEERTTLQADGGEQLIQRVGRPQGINQLRLLTVRQEPLVDAQIFF